MDKKEFEGIVKEIFAREGVGEYDRETFARYLNEEKKNSVVSVVERKGEKVFFKAIKPWADPHNLIDYRKGIVIKKILQAAKVTGFDRVILSGDYKGVFYLFAQSLPIKETLSDEKIASLPPDSAKQIRDLYLANKQKISRYLTENITQAALLYPYSDISHSFSFLGLIILFESNLRRVGILQEEKARKLALAFLGERKKEFFAAKKPYLLHGDFAPHNIIVGKEIYFVDWDRAFLIFNSLIGESFDLASLYVAAYQNPGWQEVFYNESTSFKLCLLFHLLSKMNNIITFSERSKNEAFFNWCLGKFKHVV